VEAVRARLAASGAGMEVRTDTTLRGADLVVEFAQGQSDARLRSQLLLLEELLQACPDGL